MHYLSEPQNFKLALELTGLSEDELLEVVGKFKPNHHAYPNKPKGLLISNWNGDVKIVHHFSLKTLWSKDGL